MSEIKSGAYGVLVSTALLHCHAAVHKVPPMCSLLSFARSQDSNGFFAGSDTLTHGLPP